MAASQSAPITREKAAPIIEQYFLNQNKAVLAKKEMAALNAKAKIEFIGAFADMKKGVQPAPTAIKQSDAPQIAAAPEAATSATANQVSDKTKKDAGNMDKGLAGL